MLVGRASGKRTLADVMDKDSATKRARRDERAITIKESRFFAEPAALRMRPSKLQEHLMTPAAHPSKVTAEKENIGSLPIQGAEEKEENEEVEYQEADLVPQEDGYASLSPTTSLYDAQDLSSPARPSRKRQWSDTIDSADDFGVEAISSPPMTKRPLRLRPPPLGISMTNVAPLFVPKLEQMASQEGFVGPDLRDVFLDEPTSDINGFEEDEMAVQDDSRETEDEIPGTTTPSPEPLTSDGNDEAMIGPMTDPEGEDDLDFGIEESAPMAKQIARNTEAIANGWWKQWGRSSKSTGLVGVCRVVGSKSHLANTGIRSWRYRRDVTAPL